MSYTVDINDSAIYAALRAWLLAILPGPPDVVQGLDNRVSQLLNPGVVMTVVSDEEIETNSYVYTDTLQLQVRGVRAPTDRVVQLDFYGPDAGSWAKASLALWQDLQACDFLEPYGVQPLYAETPKLMPVTSGEAQWEKRWMMQVHLQYNPTVTLPQEFADAASVILKNVEATFPA